MPSFRIVAITMFVVALVSSDSFAHSGSSSFSNRIKALKSASETAKTTSGSTKEVKNSLYKTILNSVVLVECAGVVARLELFDVSLTLLQRGPDQEVERNHLAVRLVGCLPEIDMS